MPVIAVASAAPAQAASRCDPVTFRWFNAAAGRPRNTFFSSGSVGGVTVTGSVTGPHAGTHNNQISPTTDGPSYNGYTSYYEQQLNGAAVRTGAPLTTTLLFSQPVKNLSFTFFDIDQNDISADPGFTDGVAITSHSAASGSFTTVVNSAIVGAGTSSDPWRARQGTGQIEGKEGNVAVTFQVPVSSFSWDFTDRTTKTGPGHYIGLTDLTFTPSTC